MDRNIEPMVTIVRGVYGQLTTYIDIAGVCTEEPYLDGTRLGLFAGPPDAEPRGPLVAQVTAGGLGFFELELDHGTYTLCPGSESGGVFRADMRCTTVTLDATLPIVRLDFVAGPGGGSWSDYPVSL